MNGCQPNIENDLQRAGHAFYAERPGITKWFVLLSRKFSTSRGIETPPAGNRSGLLGFSLLDALRTHCVYPVDRQKKLT